MPDEYEQLRSLLSRRTVLKGAGGALISTSFLSLVGCGGAGGGIHGASAVPNVTLNGSVVWPKGITGTFFKAMTVAGSSPVSAAGTFTVQIGKGGSQNVYLLDSFGNIVLAGPLRSGRTVLTTRSMAEFLAFQCLAAWGHVGAVSAAVWTILETTDLSGIQSAVEAAISASGNG